MEVFIPCQPLDFGCTQKTMYIQAVRYGNPEMNINNVSFAFCNGHQVLKKATAQFDIFYSILQKKKLTNAAHIRRITALLRLHRITGNHLGPGSPMACLRKAKYKGYLRHCPVLNVSKDEDSTTSLDEQFQYLAILTVEKNSLTFKQDFLYFSLWPMTLVCVLNIT